MHTFPQIPWLTDWKTKVGHDEQLDYLKSEMERVSAAGAPLLSMILNHWDKRTTDTALGMLKSGAVQHRLFFRLVPGATPPERDPQGREIHPSKRGRVLIAKTGTKGGQIDQSSKRPEAVVGQFTGPEMRRKELIGADNYVCVEITHDKVTELPIDKAPVVLAQYGFRIREPRYHARNTDRQIDFWLVEEIPPQFVNNDGTVREPKSETDTRNPKRAA